METQGKGPIITLSTPVVVTGNNPSWTSQSRMAGIAAVDIHIKVA